MAGDDGRLDYADVAGKPVPLPEGMQDPYYYIVDETRFQKLKFLLIAYHSLPKADRFNPIALEAFEKILKSKTVEASQAAMYEMAPIPDLIDEVWKVPVPEEASGSTSEVQQERIKAIASVRKLLEAHLANFQHGFEELFSSDTLEMLELPFQAVALFIPYLGPDGGTYRVVYRVGEKFFFKNLMNHSIREIDPKNHGIRQANHIAYLVLNGEQVQWQIVNGGIGAKDFQHLKNRMVYAKLLEQVAAGTFHEEQKWTDVKNYLHSTRTFYSDLEKRFAKQNVAEGAQLAHTQSIRAEAIEKSLRKRFSNIEDFQFTQLTLIGPNMESTRLVPLAFAQQGAEIILIDLMTGAVFQTKGVGFEAALEYFKKESRYRRNDLEQPTFVIYTDWEGRSHVENMDPQGEWCGRRCQELKRETMSAVIDISTLAPLWGGSRYDRAEGIPEWVGLTQMGVITAGSVGITPWVWKKVRSGVIVTAPAGEASAEVTGLLVSQSRWLSGVVELMESGSKTAVTGFGIVGAAVMLPCMLNFGWDAFNDFQHKRYVDPNVILYTDSELVYYFNALKELESHAQK